MNNPNERIHEWILDNYPDDDILLFDGMESAFLGVTRRMNEPLIAVYDYDLIVDAVLKMGVESYEEAVEYVDFNVIGAYMGEQTPIVIEHPEWVKVWVSY